MAFFNKNNENKPKRKKWENPLPEPKKLTVEDITSEKTKKKIVVIFIAIMFFGAIALAYLGNYRADAIGKEVDQANTKVESLQREVNKLNNTKSASDKDIAKTANSAANLGNKVAELQNKYNDYNLETQVDAVKENATLLDACFGKDDKNARTPWYTNQSSDTATSWEFKSTYSFAGNKADVVWVCKDGSGNIYAYTTAVYDAKNEVFISVERHLTAFGQTHLNATTESEYKTKLDSLIKDIQSKADDSKENKFSQEDLQKINEARQNARDEYNKNH